MRRIIHGLIAAIVVGNLAHIGVYAYRTGHLPPDLWFPGFSPTATASSPTAPRNPADCYAPHTCYTARGTAYQIIGDTHGNQPR